MWKLEDVAADVLHTNYAFIPLLKGLVITTEA